MTKLSLGGVVSKTMRSSDVNEQNPSQADFRVPPLCKNLLCIIKLSLLLLVSLLLVHTGYSWRYPGSWESVRGAVLKVSGAGSEEESWRRGTAAETGQIQAKVEHTPG